MFAANRQYARRAYAHIRRLAVKIGPRPSTGAGERAAADYAAQVLEQAGVRDVRLELFWSPRSTYAPYRWVFAAALLGTLVRRVLPGRPGAIVGAALSALATQGFYSAADLRPGWMRLLMPRGTSQNVVGVIPAREQMRRRVVIYGHLDSHRTPVFYSSPAWLRWFSRLIGAGFVSLGLNTVLYGAEAILTKDEGRRTKGSSSVVSGLIGALQAATTGLQMFGLALTTQAELSPYTPGANDNASGAATALALAERLARQPLRHTEVWIVATGCEEVGSYGMAALLARHADTLRDALLIGFDMVGIGDPAVIPVQGLLRKRRADARLLGAARAVAARRPDLRVWEHAIDAFDDSYMVARQGFRSITIDAEGRPGSPTDAEHKHWHRPSDTIERISRETLERVHTFAWELLQYLDRG